MHKFLVRATDAAGNPDPTPAKAKFKIIVCPDGSCEAEGGLPAE